MCCASVGDPDPVTGAAPGPEGPPVPRALPATEVLIGRLAWLIRLRWVAIVGSVAFIEVVRRIVAVRLLFVPLYVVLGCLAAYNVVAWLIQRRLGRRLEAESRSAPADGHRAVRGLARFLLPRTPPGVEYYDAGAARAALFASAQIPPDLCFLAVLLHFSGGIENPLRVFFVFHVIIASILLSRQATYGVATLGVLLVAVVGLGEMWGILPHHSLEVHWQPGAHLDPSIVGTQIFLLAVTLYVAAYLASSIAARLRRREVDVMVLSRHLGERAKALEEAYAELRVAERTKSQYMRKVAHELREPLGTVKTALSVALSSMGDTAPAVRDLVSRAERRAGALSEMTRELLELARAQAGRAAAERVEIEPGPLASTVLVEMGVRAGERDVTLVEDIADDLPSLFGDPESLADLVANLVGNAVRYTPAGGRVECRLRRDGSDVVLEVRDTGIGIPEADLPKVFDEFYRSPTARAAAPDGSGLGLAIVKAVVDQHEGTVSIESREGEGTCVTVRLPRMGGPTAVAGGGGGAGAGGGGCVR